MKKIRTFLMSVLLLAAGNAMADKLTVSDITIEPGQQGEFYVALENATDMYAFQFNLTLPEGISLVKDEDEEAYGVYVKGRTAKAGTFTFTKQDNGSWLIVYFNAAIDEETKEPVPIKGNSGNVMKVFVKAASTFTGTATATLSDAKITDKTTIPQQVENVTFNITSTVADGIKSIEAAGEDAPVYTLGGQRVEQPKKGIYVKDGRKVVVK